MPPDLWDLLALLDHLDHPDPQDQLLHRVLVPVVEGVARVKIRKDCGDET